MARTKASSIVSSATARSTFQSTKQYDGKRQTARSVRPYHRRAHGRVVKRTGDGSIVEFRSVVDAVRCAIEVQNGMVERNSGLPAEKRRIVVTAIGLRTRASRCLTAKH